ncbi:MAG TPA: twin-arginine translocase TatA/TatE family subunit [Gemmataceae bacterium]|jgi:sec-independent protein translocase protein TatA|nr:twin-arginine translocase TatA/TatE family subunit [Gemmataceae bacterium]
MFGLEMSHILILLLLGVLLFGKRLPEVSRSVAKTIMDLKRNYRGIADSLQNGTFDIESDRPELPPARPPMRPPQRVQPLGQKFEDGPETGSSPMV